MSGYGLRNMLVEYFRYVTLTRNGAVWAHHTTAVGSYRAWLASIWEGIGDRPGQPMPVMFDSRAGLQKWADSGNHELRPICFSNNKKPNAYFFTGNADASDWYAGTFFLWVKANWKDYRKAFKIWLDQNRSGDSIAELHKSAIICYERAITLIETRKILVSRSPQEAVRIVALVRAQIMAHSRHVNCSKSNPTGLELFALFDYTLDADHVVNKSSLKDLPDSWVLMAPVQADANRGFGSRIERSLPRYAPGVDRLELSPIIAFKLFASVMPSSQRELDQAMELVANQMGPCGELDGVIKRMHEHMNKFIKQDPA